MSDNETTNFEPDYALARDSYDEELGEWLDELHSSRRDFPNLRPGLAPLDLDDEPGFVLRGLDASEGASKRTKGKGS